MENIIKNSIISDSARLFRDIRIVDSIVKEQCTIGDGSDIVALEMDSKSEIGRRNLIRNVKIGKGSYTGTNTIIKDTDIGRYSCLSWNISIGGKNHNYNNISMYTDYWYERTFEIKSGRIEDRESKTKIGNDVWIGNGAIIMQGINVGNGSVIGAGAVITKDVEPYSIVAGIPGKPIKKRFSNAVIEALEELKWWNWSEEQIAENVNMLREPPSLEKLKKLL